MTTNTVKSNVIARRDPFNVSTHSPSPTNSEEPDNSVNLVIASLIEQLKRENENIANLMERQKHLRQELLKAQEQSLAALRKNANSQS